MNLKGVSAQLSSGGTQAILLTREGVTLETLPVVAATSAHRSFILSTWIRSYKAAAREQGIAGPYDANEPAIAESRWSDSLVVTDDGGFTVHAWACGRDGQLWHCYVVPELRRLRVATRLIELACGTGGLREYARKWPYSPHARTNPYLLCKKEEE